MFVTAWLGIVDITTGHMQCASAGHEYPMIRQPGGLFEVLRDRHGVALGSLPGLRYRDYELELPKGSTLFVYTDGVPEAQDVRQELFGLERTLQALNEAPDAEPQALLAHVQQAVDRFVDGAPQFDDLTMLCWKRNM